MPAFSAASRSVIVPCQLLIISLGSLLQPLLVFLVHVIPAGGPQRPLDLNGGPLAVALVSQKRDSSQSADWRGFQELKSVLQKTTVL
jgi:hypothetical protein